MTVSKTTKKAVIYICRNPKCSDYKKEHKQSR